MGGGGKRAERRRQLRTSARGAPVWERGASQRLPSAGGFVVHDDSRFDRLIPLPPEIKKGLPRRALLTCSRTSSLGDCSSCTKMGTAPSSMTTLVWSDVPDATLVSAHAASNCAGAVRGETEVHYVSAPAGAKARAVRGSSARQRVRQLTHLQLRRVVAREKLDKFWDDAGVDDLGDGRVALCVAGAARGAASASAARFTGAIRTRRCKNRGSPMDSSFLNFWVASYCSFMLALRTPATMAGSSSSCGRGTARPEEWRTRTVRRVAERAGGVRRRQGLQRSRFHASGGWLRAALRPSTKRTCDRNCTTRSRLDSVTNRRTFCCTDEPERTLLSARA